MAITALTVEHNLAFAPAIIISLDGAPPRGTTCFKQWFSAAVFESL
jgi:hypothetical protein